MTQQNDTTGFYAIVEISQEKCKGCQICTMVCPKGCLELDLSHFNSMGFQPAKFMFRGNKGECTACGLCYMVCPDYAIIEVKRRLNRR